MGGERGPRLGNSRRYRPPRTRRRAVSRRIASSKGEMEPVSSRKALMQPCVTRPHSQVRSGGGGPRQKGADMPRTVDLNTRIQVDLFGCHRWQGPFNVDGYGRWGKYLAHRRMFEDARGPIPPGYQVHHKCPVPVRDCVNVEHLEALPANEHHRRHRRNRCGSGHLVDASNTRQSPDGSKHCRPCNRDAQARCRQRRRDASVAHGNQR